jgi:patatin-like phospholipase/acyl hydrolase
VLAITKDNVDAPPTLFTTYDTSAGFRGCTIWQVARATSAATTFFKSIKVGRDGIEFVDAGFGYNNPCEVLIEEARRQFPSREQMRVLSIGTGLGDLVSIQGTRLSVLGALKKMATSSKKVAASLDSRYGGTGQYYRFNVEKGLEDITLSDWEKASTISAHTQNYLRESRRAVVKLVNNFLTTCQKGSGRDPSQAQQVMAVEEGGTEPQELLPNLVSGGTESRNTPQTMPVAATHEPAASTSGLYEATSG